MPYRHELKYLIDPFAYLALSKRIAPLMKRDDHAKVNGRYRICSIYFDDIFDKALRDKINGVPKREKWRIRYYDDDLNFINLEKKIKYNGLCLKLATELKRSEYEAILKGDIAWMIEKDDELIKEFYCKLKNELLKARVLVSYIREPYIYKAGNVRVTFDFAIRSSLFKNDFVSDRDDIVVLDDPQEIILEVKYDAYLPEVIRQALQIANIRQMAYSKYQACRRFG